MNQSSWADIVYLAAFVAYALAVVAVVLVILFLIRQRARDHAWRRFVRPGPLCPKCRYNLTGRTNTQCPECGATYTLDELWRLQKTIGSPGERSSRQR